MILVKAWHWFRPLVIVGLVVLGLYLFNECVSHAHASYDADDLKIFTIAQDPHYRWVPEIKKLRGHFPQEGELYDCMGNAKSYGDCAISPDIPINAYAIVKVEVLIWVPRLGFISGKHLVNDVTTPWKRNMIDLYVPNDMVAQYITCDDVIVFVKISSITFGG